MRYETDAVRLSGALLEWYDTHARVLPWRIPPAESRRGKRADPYAVWLSEVMLQQTTTTAVHDYFLKFMARWPTVEALAAARDEEVMAAWAGLGYYARARNLLKCARTVTHEMGGNFPDEYKGLLKLPGIGPYTAAAIASIAFGRPEVVMDGNIERVMARFYHVETPLPDARPELKTLAARLTPCHRPGDYAQAVMDLGATICTPRNPACGICPWQKECRAYAAGVAETLPRRMAKPARPLRYGHVYLARRDDGAWLLERRPVRGLLGGMLGWPGSEWTEGGFPETCPPARGCWQDAGAEVRHVFTHFRLHLRVHVARLPAGVRPVRGFFLSAADFRSADLPGVMRKAHAIARKALVAD